MENLSEFVVRSPSEVLNLLTVGKKRLVFAETKMNRNSSRFEIKLYVKMVNCFSNCSLPLKVKLIPCN